MKKLLFSLASAGLVMCLGTGAAAQTTPVPSPQATMQPSPSIPTVTASPMHSASPAPKKKHGLLNQLKKLLGGALSPAQVKFGITHQSQELAQLKRMKKVSYSNLRFYKVPASMLPSVNAWRSQ